MDLSGMTLYLCSYCEGGQTSGLHSRRSNLRPASRSTGQTERRSINKTIDIFITISETESRDSWVKLSLALRHLPVDTRTQLVDGDDVIDTEAKRHNRQVRPEAAGGWMRPWAAELSGPVP